MECHAFVSHFVRVLVHDELRDLSSVIAGYVRFLVRDCVVGQDWTDKQLQFLAGGLQAANRAERHLAAFQGIVDATTLSGAARAVADYYSGGERLRASIADDAANVPLPFAELPFVLWLFVQDQPRRDQPRHAALDVSVSESEVQVSVGPTQTRVAWSDETGAPHQLRPGMRVARDESNRKLTSNQINDIFIRNNGTIFIATDDGMLTGSGDKWTLQERYLNFIGVDAWNDNVWILGDDFLWQVDSKGKWSPRERGQSSSGVPYPDT